MLRTNDERVDWIYPASSAAVVREPKMLHDGYLERVDDDATARRVALWVRLPHFNQHAGLDRDFCFGIEMDEVTSTRASVWVRPSTEIEPRRPGETRAEQHQRILEWRATGREISIDWAAIHRAAGTGTFIIADGVAIVEGESAALQLVGGFDHEKVGTPGGHVRVVCAGSRMRWTRSDGADWSVESMRELSASYWRWLAAHPKRRPPGSL